MATVGTTVPEVGTIFDWDIDEILSRFSCDLQPDDRPDTPLSDAWGDLLDEKRDHDHYPDVLDSIQRHGFVRPLTAWVSGHDPYTPDAYQEPQELRFGDGHHRLAAAIELGYTTVPVEVTLNSYGHAVVSRDSGSWNKNRPIPTVNRGRNDAPPSEEEMVYPNGPE